MLTGMELCCPFGLGYLFILGIPSTFVFSSLPTSYPKLTNYPLLQNPVLFFSSNQEADV